jgi:hypothetical protein
MSRYDLDAALRATTPAEILALIERAGERVSDMCSGSGKWRMSVPVQHDDHDIVISDALRAAKRYLKCEPLAEARERVYEWPQTELRINQLCSRIEQLTVRAEAAERVVERVREEKDGVYDERNRVVAWAAAMAVALGLTVRVSKTAIEGWDAAWHNCIYIETPAGQASWHFHDDDAGMFSAFPHCESYEWDGHSTPEKYVRLALISHGRIAAALDDTP